MSMDVQLLIGNRPCKLRLLESEAPKTCQAFLSLLPIDSFALHAKFAGDEIYFMVPRLWEAENMVASVVPGDCVYYPDRQTVCIFYGEIVPFGSAGLFGRIVEGLEHIQALGQEIWKGRHVAVRVQEGE